MLRMSDDMRIIESYMRGKYADQSLCEDGVFIGSRIVAVIDGATSHGKLLWNGGRSGRFAKEVLSKFLRDHGDELVELPAAECMFRPNGALAQRIEGIHPEIYADSTASAGMQE